MREATENNREDMVLYPMTVVQPQYNMIDRYIEHEIMSVCEKYGIGITPFRTACPGTSDGKI